MTVACLEKNDWLLAWINELLFYRLISETLNFVWNSKIQDIMVQYRFSRVAFIVTLPNLGDEMNYIW